MYLLHRLNIKQNKIIIQESKLIIDTKKLQKAVMENKKKHGFNTTDIEFELLRLHGEANELFEAWRKNNKKNINEELADVGIFLLGIAEMLDSDLGEDIVNKMKINEKRIYKNGVKLGPADTDKQTDSFGLITAWSSYQTVIQFLQKPSNRQIFSTCIGLVLLFMALVELIGKPRSGLGLVSMEAGLVFLLFPE